MFITGLADRPKACGSIGADGAPRCVGRSRDGRCCDPHCQATRPAQRYVYSSATKPAAPEEGLHVQIAIWHEEPLAVGVRFSGGAMILHDGETPNDVDVCIVGSGPVGLALAFKCANEGLSVAVLEAGAEKAVTKDGGAPSGDAVTPHHVTPSLATASGLGGTSRLWSGRCVPLDDIDFEERAFVPFSGWPIAHAELSDYYGEALAFLGCGVGLPPPAESIPGGDVSNSVLERWSSQPDLSRLHGQALRTSQDINVYTGCIANETKFDGGQRATALVARRHGPHH